MSRGRLYDHPLQGTMEPRPDLRAELIDLESRVGRQRDVVRRTVDPARAEPILTRLETIWRPFCAPFSLAPRAELVEEVRRCMESTCDAILQSLPTGAANALLDALDEAWRDD